MYGNLLEKELSFTIEAECANSGKQMKIELDSELNIIHVPGGSDPMFCIPITPLAKTKDPSIVNVF